MSTVSSKWTMIDDFSPGIHSAGTWQLSGSGVAGGIISGAPLGAAQETNTYRCVPTPNGKGLMPGPRGTDLTFARSILAGTPANIDYAAITGLTTYPGDTSPFGPVISLLTREPGLGTRDYVIAPHSTTGVMDILFRSANNALGTIGQRASVSFAKQSVNTVSPYLTPGTYGLFYGVGGSASTTNYTAGVPSAADSVAWAYGMRLIAHQNRIVGFRSGAAIFNVVNAMSGINQYYILNYTDPANSNVFPTTSYNIDPEDRTGVNAMGALNANTLLLVKGGGFGGIVVQGDIANPIITKVPGIAGTNLVSTDAGIGPLGIAYASGGNGMHAWSGGATSSKISTQLRDDFFRCEAISAALFNTWSGDSNSPGWQVSSKYWNNYLMVSNGWMLHVPTGGWWRIEPTTTMQQLYWEPSYYGNTIIGTYGTAFSSLSATVTWGRQFDNTLGATSWSWQSQAIPATIHNQVVVNELVVTAQGAGTIQLSGRGWDGTSATATPAVTVTLPAEAANQPVKIRVPYSLDGYNIIVRMVADNGSSTAPTVHSLAIGYDEGNETAVQ
jgi:hypothetical protein